jgi:hypothetical protein
MRSRKLLALFFCLITFPAIAGYMTLLGAGVGNISPTVSWVAGTDPFPDTSLTYSGPSLSTMFDSTGKLTYKPNNLFQYGNLFSSWRINSAGVTFTSGQSDPDGGNAGWLITGTGSGNATFDYYPQDYGGSQGLNQILSIGVKAGTASNFGIADVSAGYIVFDLANGTVVTNTSSQMSSPTITPLTGGWYRVSIKLTKTNQFWYNTLFIGTSYPAPAATTGTIYAYKASLSAVTYETTPRPGDQVITTSAAYYGPRIDYDPNTLAVKGLLIEEARTNLVVNSNQFTSWSIPGGSSVATNSNTQIDGTTTGNTFSLIAGVSGHQIYKSYTGTAAAYTNSVYAKAGTSSWLGMWFLSTAQADGAFFNLSNGTVGTIAAGTTATIQSIGSGWYRCSITKALTAATYYNGLEVHTADNQAYNFNAAGTENLYLFGAQGELGSSASSYTPTDASAVTRAAETVQLTGSALAVMQGASGTAFVQTTDMATNSSTSQTLLGLANGGTMGYPLFYWPANTKITTVNASVTLSTAVTPTLTSPVRAGIAWSAAGRSIANNGGTVATDANPFSSAAVTGAYLGVGNGGALYWLNGHIASAAFYNSRLPDATLQAKSVVGASYAANDNGIRYAFADNDNLPIHWRVAL